jgi:hypothetical protein
MIVVSSVLPFLKDEKNATMSKRVRKRQLLRNPHCKMETGIEDKWGKI